MMYRLTTLLFLLVFASMAADVSGKWIAQVPGREGQTREQVFNFKVDGDKLTGTTTGFQGNEIQISDGKVTGDNIAFKVKVEFQGNAIEQNYKGTVSGDEIKMTREGGRGPAREFTAKRAK